MIQSKCHDAFRESRVSYGIGDARGQLCFVDCYSFSTKEITSN